MNIVTAATLVVTSIILTKVYCLMANNTRLMDKPNDRSLHSTPIIRGGGLVFISLPLVSLPFLCYFSNTSMDDFWVLILGALALGTVSFLDDLYTLSVKPRFLVQSIVALLIAVGMRPMHLDFVFFTLSSPIFTIPLLFFTVLWAINHFNFMDGIDGICALQAVFLFAAYAVMFSMISAFLYQDFCLLLICSLLGFLVFNFPPARLFMGDVGSATLGLLVFAIALMAQQKYNIPILYWFMLNAVFLFDATVTLIRRVVRKEKWSAPHRKHAYQRLKQSGLKTRTILLAQSVCNICILALVLAVDAHKLPAVAAVFIELFALSALYYGVERRFPMS